MGFRRAVRDAVVVGTALASGAAYADGVCEKGYRDTTPAERETMLAVMETARAALPSAPEGWSIGGYEVLSPIATLCMDAENTPLGYSFSRTLNRVDDLESRDRAVAEVGARVRAAQEARQPRQDAIMAKMSALGGELAAAAQRGDEARVEAIQREIEQVTKEFEALAAEAEDPAALEAIAAATAQDRTMSIAVQINSGAHAYPEMRSVAAPAGAHSAYRWTTADTGVETAHALILFGAWQPRPEGGVLAGPRGAAPIVAAHSIALSVDADPGRLDSLLASIDFGAIAALTR